MNTQDFKVIVPPSESLKMRDWLDNMGGIAIYNCLALESAGKQWYLPAKQPDGTPCERPHHSAAAVPTIVITGHDVGIECGAGAVSLPDWLADNPAGVPAWDTKPAKPLYSELASIINSLRQFDTNESQKEWRARREDALTWIEHNLLPRGSGIDSGCKIDLDRCTAEKIVITFGYHHMDDNGFYDGWTEHTLTVRPSLQHGIDLRISGRDRNSAKEYLYDIFSETMHSPIPRTTLDKAYGIKRDSKGAIVHEVQS